MKRKIKVGIVGLGRAGVGMQSLELEKYKDRFEIAAGCDNAPDRLTNLPERFAGAKLYGDYAQMLADPAIELVTVATRHPDHTPMALQALAAGKAVCVDKPYALNDAEMAVLAGAMKQYPNKVFLRHNRRFEAPFVKVMSLLKSGVIGDVVSISNHRHCLYCRRNDWMTMTEFGGGLLTNWGPHVIDQTLQMLGSPAEVCWADVRSVLSIGDGDDYIRIMLRADNGSTADIVISGFNTLPEREIEIQGTRGNIVYPVDGKIKLRYVDPEIVFQKLSPHPENPPMQYGNFDETLTFVEQLVDLPPVVAESIWERIYDTLTAGTPFPITAEDGIAVTKVMTDAFRKADFTPAEKFLNGKI